MNLAETMPMEATLSIFVLPTDGSAAYKYFEGLNKITDKARAHLMHLVTDNPVLHSPNPITGFKVGSGGVGAVVTGAETDLFTPITPTGNYNTGLVYGYSSSERMATFSFQLGPDDANTLAISEVGMFASNDWLGNALNGKMFNIKTFPEVIKSAAFSLAFVWKVNFSGVYV